MKVLLFRTSPKFNVNDLDANYISDGPDSGFLWSVQIFSIRFISSFLVTTSPIEARSRLAIEKAIYEVIVPDPSTPLPPFVSISFRFVMVLQKPFFLISFKPDSDLS